VREAREKSTGQRIDRSGKIWRFGTDRPPGRAARDAHQPRPVAREYPQRAPARSTGARGGAILRNWRACPRVGKSR